MLEKTLVILKPDALERNLVGRIITYFEEAGLKIAETKMMRANEALLDAHYRSSPEWLEALGRKSLAFYAEKGMDIKAELGTDDAGELGRIIKGWLIAYMMSGPVLPMVIGGNEAVAVVRKLVGDTLPAKAAAGTIRGRFCTDSSDNANAEGRCVRNLAHASGNAQEAEYEIGLWFGGAGS